MVSSSVPKDMTAPSLDLGDFFQWPMPRRPRAEETKREA